MQELVQRTWRGNRRFHVGDLAWSARCAVGAEDPTLGSLWLEDGRVVGWARAEAPGHLELLVDDHHVGLMPEILDWFEDTVDGEDLTCLVMQTDKGLRAALEERGYRVQPDEPFYTRFVRDLFALPRVTLPPGYTFSSVRADQAGRRAAAHRAGWSDVGTSLTEAGYAEVMASYPYRPETDVVVVSPDGEWVASALGWYDEVNRVGLLEPVSCDPGHRRRGLARAAVNQVLHAFLALGGDFAVALPRGDTGHPGPAALFRRIGFLPSTRTVLHRRQRIRP